MEKVPTIRETFLTKYAGSMGDYHPTDVERVKTDDTYVLWFFQSKGVEEAPDAIDVALKFRKNLCLHDMKKSDFTTEMIDGEVVYWKNKDNKGNPILHIRPAMSKNLKKDKPELKKYIPFLFEEKHKMPLQKIVIMFDMTDSGLTTMDTDFIKYIIGAIKNFPQLLAYIILYDMGTLVKVIWPIVKAMLTTKEMEYLKKCEKKEIDQYIDKDQLEPHMLKHLK